MLKLFKIILDLHDGEVGADAGTGDAASAADGEAVAAGQQTEEAEADLDAEFEQLKRGKYKAQFDKEVQGLINKRFAKSKETEASLKAQLDEQNKLIDLLHSRNGTKSIEELYGKIENDESYLEQKAYEMGLTRDQVKEFEKMERHINEMERVVDDYKSREAEAAKEAQANAQVEKWRAEEAEIKAVYPGFDLETEIQNEQFARLISANIPVKTAFEVTHHDEIMQAGIAYASKETAKKVTENIRARGARPQEIGASNKASFTSQKDIADLSLEQIREIVKTHRTGDKLF